MLEIKGKIIFSPDNITTKHEKQAEWKKTAMVFFYGCDVANYYAWFLNKRYNIILNPPLRGAHVSFINDRVFDLNAYEQAKELFDKKEVSVFYDPKDLRYKTPHWFIKVHSEELKAIRQIAGFEREPYHGLHLTIGYANVKNVAHSDYIKRMMEFYNEYYI